jgi:pSer/pThr/pTyr-binding forkhead associated (FHA) protein
MPRLVVLTEGFKERSCELKVGKTTIGRVEDNAFQIPEPSVSSHHCEISLLGTVVSVKDLDSTNGTFIDGNPVKEAVLKSGQTLRLGQVELRFENGAPGAPAAPAKAAPAPAGVKLNELETGPRAKSASVDGVFKKKSNKANKIFMFVGITLGLIIIAALVVAFLKSPGTP